MGDPATRDATYEDLLAVDPPQVAELMHGQLIVSPRPRFRHAAAAGDLFTVLNARFRKLPTGWWFLVEPELHLGLTNPRSAVLVPDIAGWRRENVPTCPDVAAAEVAPDWVCEVLSPSSARWDRIVKTGLYADAGVSHYWIIDPELQTLEVFALRDGVYALVGRYAGEDVIHAEPFAEVTLSLSDWWLA